MYNKICVTRAHILIFILIKKIHKLISEKIYSKKRSLLIIETKFS